VLVHFINAKNKSVKKTFLVVVGTNKAIAPGIIMAITGILAANGENKCIVFDSIDRTNTVPDLGKSHEYVTIDLPTALTNEDITFKDLAPYVWTNYMSRTQTSGLVEMILNQTQRVMDILPIGWTEESFKKTAELLPWLKDVSIDFVTFVDGVLFTEKAQINTTKAVVSAKVKFEMTRTESFGGSFAHVGEGEVPFSAIVSPYDKAKTPWVLIVGNQKCNSLSTTLSSIKNVFSGNKKTENLFLAKVGQNQYQLVSVMPAKVNKKMEVEVPSVIGFITDRTDKQLVPYEMSGNTVVFKGDLGAILGNITNLLNQFTTVTEKSGATTA